MARKTKVAAYLARKGDSLAQIAHLTRLAPERIRAFNPQLDADLTEGDFLTLPVSAFRPSLHARIAAATTLAWEAVGDDPLVLQVALRELGQTAAPGIANNNRIIEYLHSVESLDPTLASSDETDWCSCFVNWCVEQSGMVGTNKPNAQSWKSWGRDVAATPRRGSIAVFQRWKDDELPSWKGHVGFLLEIDANNVVLLGGNQSRAVSKGSYRATARRA